MNDQNQNDLTNGVTVNSTPVNGGMFTAPPAFTATPATPTPVKIEPVKVEPVQTSDVVEDNPFFRLPKPMETTPIAPAPATPATVTSPFNPVVNPIPSDVMEKAIPAAKVVEPIAKIDEKLPDWMQELKTPIVAERPVSPVAPVTPIQNTNTVPIVPNLSTVPIMDAVKPAETMSANEVVKQSDPIAASPFTALPAIAPIVSVTTTTNTLPKLDTQDDNKDKPVAGENHKVRDIFLVLVVIILAVLALVLGVALATNAIP
jgi:hypothetical protein